jgi:hypothetical protein
MSDELQAEVDRLKAENAKLARDLAGAHDDLKEVRGEARERRHENKALTLQLETTARERDDFKTKAETTAGEWQARIDQANGTVRAMKHDKAFEKVARTLKVNDPSKFKDLIDLAKYAPEGDEPDEARIAQTFQEALKGRPWLVDQPAAEAAPTAPGGANGAKPAQVPAVPGPGSDRGQSVSSPASQAAAKPAGRL